MRFFTLIFYIISMTICIHFIFGYYYEQFSYFTQQKQYVTISLFTIKQAGLGNCFFELLALLGVADSTNRIAFVNSNDSKLTDKFKSRFKENFPNLYEKFELRNIEKDELRMVGFHGHCCKYTNPRIVRKIPDENLYLKGSYFQSYLYFDHLHEKVREWLTPAKKFMDLADSFIKPHQADRFKICVHTRRGDFAPGKMHSPTNLNFTIPAIKFLLSEYDYDHHNNIMLVLIGNDEKFEKSIGDKFKNTEKVILPKSDPEKDLAFSIKYCDVVLITAPSSTFGWWLGYLSKTGNLVYYEDILETADKVAQQMYQQDFYPKHWIKLVTNNKTGSVNKL